MISFKTLQHKKISIRFLKSVSPEAKLACPDGCGRRKRREGVSGWGEEGGSKPGSLAELISHNRGLDQASDSCLHGETVPLGSPRDKVFLKI